MIKNDSTDEAISPVIAFVLILGFLVIAWTTIQTQVIPSEDRQIELNHNKKVIDDLIQLRTAIVDASSTNNDRSVSINLGTRYPARALFLSPSSANGQIYTHKIGDGEFSIDSDIDLNSICGIAPNTTSITYTPYYKRLDFPNVTFSNTLLYKHFSNGEKIVETPSKLVEGDVIHLHLLKGNISETGVGSVSIDFKPSNVTGAAIVEDISELTIPTKLSAQKWNEILDQDSVESVIQSTDNTVTINLDDSITYTLKCSVLGIGKQFKVNPTTSLEEISQGNDGQVNPKGDVQLVNVIQEQRKEFNNRNSFVLTFRNNADEARTMEKVRINMYYTEDDQIDHILFNDDIDVYFMDWFKSLNSPITIPSGGTEIVTLVGKRQSGSLRSVTDTDFFVLSVEYERGDRLTYFVFAN